MEQKTEGGAYAIAGVLYMALGVVAGGITWMDSGSVVYGIAVVVGMAAIAMPLLALAKVLEALSLLRREVGRLSRDKVG